ncbi:MAG: hypothetical protein AVDCRST_MAG49-439, partial [uncultured Thermomicrobiales bacterium]
DGSGGRAVAAAGATAAAGRGRLAARRGAADRRALLAAAGLAGRDLPAGGRAAPGATPGVGAGPDLLGELPRGLRRAADPDLRRELAAGGGDRGAGHGAGRLLGRVRDGAAPRPLAVAAGGTLLRRPDGAGDGGLGATVRAVPGGGAGRHPLGADRAGGDGDLTHVRAALPVDVPARAAGDLRGGAAGRGGGAPALGGDRDAAGPPDGGGGGGAGLRGLLEQLRRPAALHPVDGEADAAAGAAGAQRAGPDRLAEADGRGDTAHLAAGRRLPGRPAGVPAAGPRRAV